MLLLTKLSHEPDLLSNTAPTLTSSVTPTMHGLPVALVRSHPLSSWNHSAFRPPPIQTLPSTPLLSWNGLLVCTLHNDGTEMATYLFQIYSVISAKIGKEFDMYEHHFQPHTTKPKMGFLRNMFFSLTQQLVRQDPVWYALNAA